MACVYAVHFRAFFGMAGHQSVHFMAYQPFAFILLLPNPVVSYLLACAVR